MQTVTKYLMSLCLLALSWIAGATSAPFNQAAFDKAVAAGGPVIVQFHAD
jgi:hypothetical protein